jgi:hypothetical protein
VDGRLKLIQAAVTQRQKIDDTEEERGSLHHLAAATCERKQQGTVQEGGGYLGGRLHFWELL